VFLAISACSCSGSGTSWEASPRDMREEDAHAIAARLGSYERTCSTEVPRFRSVGRQSEEMMPKPAKKVKTYYVSVSACALPARNIRLQSCKRPICLSSSYHAVFHRTRTRTRT